MAVKWLKEKEVTGSATLTKNYLMTNTAFMDKFINCYRAVVGVDDDDKILLKPISLDQYESLQFKEMKKVPVNVQKSFVRFGNTKLMQELKDLLEIEIPKDGVKATTSWDEKEDCLIVDVNGGEDDDH